MSVTLTIKILLLVITGGTSCWVGFLGSRMKHERIEYFFHL